MATESFQPFHTRKHFQNSFPAPWGRVSGNTASYNNTVKKHKLATVAFIMQIRHKCMEKRGIFSFFLADWNIQGL